MKKNLLLLLLFNCTGIVWSQIPYFNIQINTQNETESFWEIGTYGAIETDSFYYITGGNGTPYPALCDTSLNVKINKYNLEVEVTKLGEGKGATIAGYLEKEWKPVLPVYGYVFDCHKVYGNVDFYLGKIENDTFASTQTKVFGEAGWDEFPIRGIKDTKGNYVLAGWHFPADDSRYQSILVFKADSSFNQVFYRSYPSVNPIYDYFGTGIVETADGGYVVTGSHHLPDDEDAALIFEIDSMGVVQWWQEFEPDHEFNEKNLYFSGIAKAEDGGYIVVGSKTINPSSFYEETYWVAGLSTTGELLWENVFGLNHKLAATKIISASDGNYLISGAERDPVDFATNYEKQSASIGKITPQGNLLWLRKYHEEQIYAHIDKFTNVIPTSDGGMLCVGNTRPNDEERQNIWVIKLDSLGCAEPGCGIEDAVVGLPIGAADPILLYPNPTSGQFRIGMQEGTPSITRVRINDAGGREVFAGDYHGATEVVVDLSGESGGVYFCRVEADGVWYVRGVVVR